MVKKTSFKQLLIEEIQDLYSAETQLVKALPKMAKTAHSEELKAGFEKHLEETKTHAEWLESVLHELDAGLRGKTCTAMAGFIAESSDCIKERGEPAVRDAGLIAVAQRIEHYEIVGYGCARTFANVLGFEEIAEKLQEILDEEATAGEMFTAIAKSVNFEATRQNKELEMAAR